MAQVHPDQFPHVAQVRSFRLNIFSGSIKPSLAPSRVHCPQLQAMDALSVLAIVTQRYVLPAGQEAIQKAILKAELERTRLDYERSRMLAEDNRQKYINNAHSTRHSIDVLRANVQYLSVRVTEYIEEVEELEGADRDNEQYIEHLRDKKRKLKRKYENLCNETDKQYHDVCFLEHTGTNDTELNDRKKFMRLFNKSSPKHPLVLTYRS